VKQSNGFYVDLDGWCYQHTPRGCVLPEDSVWEETVAVDMDVGM